MTDFTAVAATYLETWNETDETRRLELIEQHWATDARYVDPMASVEGRAAISELVGAVQAQFPGFVFSIDRPADGHGSQLRFGWGLGEPGKEPVAFGFDVAVLDDAGRIAEVRGFLEQVPSGT